MFSFLQGGNRPIQTAEETIEKLTDRVTNATLIEDRRGAVLGLKGLAREYKLVWCSTTMRRHGRLA